MADTVKRLNYFDHQFLRRQDFADEQAYHLAQRRTHNRLLHTPGVAGGLEVKLAAGGRQLLVGEGVAIDAQGREIVLAADAGPLELGQRTNATLYVTIAYAEREVDPSAETGVQGNRRVEEAPDVQLATDPPANPGLTLVLARVTFDKDGAATVDGGDGAARRRTAGAGGGEGEVRQLTFTADAVAAGQWPSMRAPRAGTVEVRGSLSVTADTFTGGSLGVGTTKPEARMQVVNAPQDSNGNTLVLGPVGGSNLRMGYHADYSWIQSHGLKPLRINEISNDIILNRAGNARVGVGTDPAAQLHVSRHMVLGPLTVGEALGRLELSGAASELSFMDRGVTKFGGKAGERFVLYAQEMRFRLWTQERGDLLNVTPDGRLSLGAGPGPQQLNLSGGIGFTNQNAADKRLWSPADGLLRWQTHNAAGTHAFEVGHQTDAAAVHLDTAGPSWLTGGFLGIGRPNPAAALHVEAKDTQLILQSPDAGARIALVTEGGKSSWDFGIGGGRAGARDWWIGDGRAVHLTIADGTGFTGLGTAKPESKLHVVGDVRIDGKLIARDGVPGATQWASAGGGISYTGASTFVDVGEGDMPFRVRTKSGAVGYLETSTNNAFLRIATNEGINNRVELCNRGGGRLALWTAGFGDAVNVTRDGKVGIKTTAPTHEFHVQATDGPIALFETKGNSAALRVSTSEGFDNRVEFCARPGARLALWTAGAGDALNILRDGKTGIGTQTPNRTLHVRGADALGTWESTGDHAYFALHTREGWDNRVEVVARPGGRLALWSGGMDTLNVTKDGKVGIGLPTPNRTLHVKGADALGTWESTGDHAYFALFTREGWQNRVEIVNRPGGRLALWSGDRDTLNVMRDGKVGIGTVNPSHNFHMYSPDGAVGLFETAQNNAFLRVSTNEGMNNRVELCNRPGGRLALWTGGAGDVVNVTRGGAVGIGTEAPEAKLQIIHTPQNPGGNALILGPTGGSNLRMGYDTEYSWIQSHGSKPLRINQIGNNVSIGEFGAYVSPVQFHVRRGIACGPWARVDAAEGRIEATGPIAEISFAKRQLTSWPAVPQAGDRYLFYNDGGLARFWTEAIGDIMTIDAVGNMWLRGRIQPAGGKVGYVIDHFVNATGDALEEGDVVVVSGTQPADFYGIRGNIPVPEVDLTDVAGDSRVCGVVAHLDDTEAEVAAATAEDAPPPPKKRRGKAAADAPPAYEPRRVEAGQRGSMVTLGAFAHCKVDATYGAIAPGDLLMASPTRGHAQKVTDRASATGCIVGKALGALEEGTGKIPVMVLLQ
jgi:hypothetical protein